MRSLLIVMLFCCFISIYSLDYYRDVVYDGSCEVEYTKIDGIYSKVYIPRSDEKSLPFIIFSHGLGGNVEAAVYALKFWALNGYVVIVPTHVGSDSSIFKDADSPFDKLNLFKKAASLKNASKRIDDIRKIISYLKEHKINGISPESFGMSGHSFGAVTTFSVSGVRRSLFSRSEYISDIKASMAFSPTPPDVDFFQSALYRDVKIPVFHITGTEDVGIIKTILPKERTIPFQKMNKNENFLLVFNGASHFIFSGRNQMPVDEKLIYKDIKRFTLAFWDKTLRNDEKAKRWLFNMLKEKNSEYEYSIRVKGKNINDEG